MVRPLMTSLTQFFTKRNEYNMEDKEVDETDPMGQQNIA